MKQGADRPEKGETERGNAQPEGKRGGVRDKKLPVPVGGAGSGNDGGERSVEKASANGGATGR